ncbi:MAG TPA: hypothetical protein VGZ02_10905 [Candidatus Baltobacteraceae bacterium]|jgi:hypothetical protein|nr:hypothetical protein [Candidatus Baltobacteraceae bacterium]
MFAHALLAAIIVAASAAPAATSSPAVPAGVRVTAEMVSTVDSATAKTGDMFTFKTTQNAQIGDQQIPAGTTGQGVVAAVSAASGAHRGTLSLTPQFLVLADGRHIHVAAATPTSYAARRHIFPFPIPVPGVVMVGGIENPGGNVRIGPGTTFAVVIAPRT